MENFIKAFIIIFVCLNLFLAQVALGKYIFEDVSYSFNVSMAVVLVLVILLLLESFIK